MSTRIGIGAALIGAAGLFAQPVSFNVPATVAYEPSIITSTAQADFNGDGKPDIVVAALGALQGMLGNGDGTFRVLAGFSIPGASIGTNIAIGDFNGDGRSDLAVGSGDAAYVFLGNGDGTFANPSGFRAGNDVYFLAVGDFNHDGKLDLASANYK